MSTVYNKQQHTLEMPLWLVIKNYRWPGCEKICCRERSKRSVRKSHFKRSIKIWPVWASIWALIFAFEMPLIWRFLSAYFKINALSSHWVSECSRQLEWKSETRCSLHKLLRAHTSDHRNMKSLTSVHQSQSPAPVSPSTRTGRVLSFFCFMELLFVVIHLIFSNLG